jgi:hypothetical protein
MHKKLRLHHIIVAEKKGMLLFALAKQTNGSTGQPDRSAAMKKRSAS